MAAEVPVCDVLCEAMEYLSKLGSNLRTRSENLKQKRINKDKLKNAHAVHKAASKVLLICELSKKSLENVETGVRKVLSLVDADQAHSGNGGKKNDPVNKERFYHFDFDSHKLCISKKIPLKHYMSVKVLAKGMTTAMLEKYPVFYDCKLKRQRRPSEKHKSVGRFENSLKRKRSSCHSDTNQTTDKSKDSRKESIESDTSESAKSSRNNASRKNSVNYHKNEIDKRKSLELVSNSDIEHEISSKTIDTDTARIPDSIPKTDNYLQSKDGVSEQNITNIDNSNNESKLEKKKHLEDLAVSDLIECFLNEAKVDDNLANKECDSQESTSSDERKPSHVRQHKQGEKEAISVRKKFSKIKIVDDSSDGDDKTLKNHQKETPKETHSSSKENGSNSTKKNKESKPMSKKIKLSDRNDDSQSNGDSDHNSTASKNSENDQKDKPIIRCVNITKLLKPDILDSKTSEQTKKIKHTMNKTKSDSKHNKDQRKFCEDSTIRSKSDMTNDKNDEEYWSLKRNEVKQFKPKHFTVNVVRLPQISINFLLTHNLRKIIQGCKIICEVENKQDKDSVKDIDDVKNALLNDSGSEDSSIALIAKSKKVKQSLLHDSDSDKGLNCKVADDNSDICQEKTDPAAIKDALLHESDSENNQDQMYNEIINKALESDPKDSPKESEQGVADRLKNALLNDSDSDKNQNEDNNEIMPTLQGIMNVNESVEFNANEMSQTNNDENLCFAKNMSQTIEQDDSIQDQEKIKSSLLNESSDCNSESSAKKKLKMPKHKRKHAFKSMQAKKNLLHHSSTSENEKEHSEESDIERSKIHARKRDRRKSRISSSSTSSEKVAKKHKKKNSRHSSSQEENKAKDEHLFDEDKDSRNIDQVDGNSDEQSNSSVSKVRR